MNVAIIPARGGSKRIPRKNLRRFAGRPMIEWSIRAARDSGCFARILVSTDDREIAEVARGAGAEVPFMRPPELADDFVGTIPVIRHAVEWLSQNAAPFDFACCVYATAPLLQSADLRTGLEVLQSSGSDYAFSVVRYGFPPQRAIRVTNAGRVAMFQPEQFTTRSQDLEEMYHDAAQFYWGRRAAWLNSTPIFSEAAAPVILPGYRVQDIDTEEDWIRAELMFRVMRENAS